MSSEWTAHSTEKRKIKSFWAHKRVVYKDEDTFPPRPIRAKPAVIVCKPQQKQLYQTYSVIWFRIFVQAKRAKVEMHIINPKRSIILLHVNFQWPILMKFNISSLSRNEIVTTSPLLIESFA